MPQIYFAMDENGPASTSLPHPAKRSKVYDVDSRHFFNLLRGLLPHSTTRAATLLAVGKDRQFVNILTNQTARDACLRSLHRAIHLLCFDRIQSNRLTVLSLIEEAFNMRDRLKPHYINLIILLVETLHRDEDVEVRRKSLQLLVSLARKIPMDAMFTRGINKCRILDHVFVLCCDSLNDYDEQVKNTAIIGMTFIPLVHKHLLSQTLTKDLLDHFSSKSTELVPLMPRRACGALIHALEDEHKSIRMAALDCIKAHGINQDFGDAVVRILVDTMSDESDKVRLKAMQVLLDICSMHRIELPFEDVQAILCIIDDKESVFRDAARNILSQAYLPNIDAIKKCLQCATYEMQRFRQERDKILLMCARIARNHPDGLLSLNLYANSSNPEPQIEDDGHRIRAVMWMVACGVKGVEELPGIVTKHKAYLLTRFPDCFSITS